MRPVETLLVVTNLLTFVVGVVPRLHATRFLGGVVLIPLSLAVVQVLLEGPRWVLPLLVVDNSAFSPNCLTVSLDLAYPSY